jgi:hypothetical protein
MTDDPPWYVEYDAYGIDRSLGLYSDQPVYEYRRKVPPSRATYRAAATRSNPAGITPDEVRSQDGRVPQ